MIGNVGEILGHLVERLVEVRKKAHDKGFDKSACKGCTVPACCNQVVLSSPIENIVLLLGAPGAVHYHWATLVARAEAELDLFKRALLLPTETGSAIGSDQADIWWREQRPCAFLVDGRCDIWAGRPLTCALHFLSEEGRPSQCVYDPERLDVNIPVLDFNESLTQAQQMLHAIAGGSGLPTGIEATAPDQSKRTGLAGLSVTLVLMAFWAMDRRLLKRKDDSAKLVRMLSKWRLYPRNRAVLEELQSVYLLQGVKEGKEEE
jgi:hypothetical protein